MFVDKRKKSKITPDAASIKLVSQNYNEVRGKSIRHKLVVMK